VAISAPLEATHTASRSQL